MIPIILAFCVFVFVVKNLRFIIGCTIALLVAGFIMAPAHTEEYCHVNGCHDTPAELNAYYGQAETMCQTVTNSDAACMTRDAIANKFHRLGYHFDFNEQIWVKNGAKIRNVY